MRRRVGGFALLLCGIAILSPETAFGETLTMSFINITNNNVSSAATGEAQLFVDVTNDGVGANQAKFVFRNVGPNASSICDVYFDDVPPPLDTLGSIAQIINTNSDTQKVNFSQGASPSNLPGGSGFNPAFQTTAGLLADSDAPTSKNGVNPGETLGIIFNLLDGKTFTGLINSLRVQDPTDPTVVGLRIGIHVQGFAGGYSESFITRPLPPLPPPPPGGGDPGGDPNGGVAPEPSSLVLCLFAMASCSFTGVRRMRRKQGAGGIDEGRP